MATWFVRRPPPPPPEDQPVAVALVVGLLGAVLLAVLLRRLFRPTSTAHLQAQLTLAEARVLALRNQLSDSSSAARAQPFGTEAAPEQKVVRIWMDGAFDMMHYGHVNAFRQGRALGTHLVVGVNDDESITRCKGPPVMSDAERLAMVEGCKFVDEVVPNVPYVMSDEYVRWMMRMYKIDYVVHGDDPCIVDGRDVYESAQRLGKYRTIPRTEGVSTTEIVGRMLLLTTDHHNANAAADTAGEMPQPSPQSSPLLSSLVTDAAGRTLSHAIPLLPLDGARAPAGGAPSAGSAASAAIVVPPSAAAAAAEGGSSSFVPSESKFLTTSRMLRLFASGCIAPPPGAKVVYVDGGWDMFHAGHVDFLRRARALGDFLIVGVHNDVVVNRHRGRNFPIMNLNERTLSVLACKHVGDVVIDPPWHMTREMIAALSISVVAHGSMHDPNDDYGLDPYAVPKQLGLFVELPSNSGLTVDTIVARIRANHERMAAKVERKMAVEKQYYENRYGFATAPEPAG